MRYAPFGISNIAWPPDVLEEALAMLPGIGCAAVEIAPFNVFKRWDDTAEAAKRLRDLIERHDLTCSALQGILYGVPDVALFESEASRARLEQHLDRVAALAGLLGAKACVFGAPRQRDPGNLPVAKAWDVAVATLRRVGPAFAAQGSALAFEANARHYGCRFVTTTAEAVRLVAEVGTPGIGLQIDTGTLLLEAEPPGVLAMAAPLAVHAHVSEPDLQPPGGANHAPIAAALRESGYMGSLSIEMKQVEDWRNAIPAAAAFVKAAYA
jgi:D-psicose/D-tagatose/L-ribulose 3-epimerase